MGNAGPSSRLDNERNNNKQDMPTTTTLLAAIAFVFIPYSLCDKCHPSEGFSGSLVEAVLIWMKAEAESLDQAVEY